jgi:type IV secretory pathway VirB4 component
VNIHLGKKIPPAPPSGMIGPDSVEVFPRRIRAGDIWCETYAVTGYPREVGPAWLAPLLSYPGSVDVSLHVEPIRNDSAADQVKRQLARFESTRRMDAEKNKLPDPQLETAVEDAGEFMASLARGEGRLFKVGLYFTVRADSSEALDAEVLKVRSLCSSLLMDTRPVTFRAMQGWLTTLPFATDSILMRRSFDTKALAACFPFANAEIESSGGILYGLNKATGGLVLVDRFSLPNYNQVILSSSGAGKSYFAKTQIIRNLIEGYEVLVIDPENEYLRLAEALGGKVIRLPDGARLNPLDLSAAGTPGAVMEQALFIHTLVSTLIGEMNSQDKAALDRAILGAYSGAGISEDPKSHGRPAPLMSDVVGLLETDNTNLALRLEPFVKGSYSRLFNGPTTIRPQGHLVVFSLKNLSPELKGAGTLLALEAIWQRLSRGEPEPRVVVVDEAWWIVENAAGARFLQKLAKAGRKRWCGLTVISQNVEDVLSTDLGQAIVTNSAHQVLLQQSPQAIEAIGRAFNLSEGERSLLVTCEQGEGLLCLGSQRAVLQFKSSDWEHPLCTSNPAELVGDSGGITDALQAEVVAR